jgi:hypothetical protein
MKIIATVAVAAGLAIGAAALAGAGSGSASQTASTAAGGAGGGSLPAGAGGAPPGGGGEPGFRGPGFGTPVSGAAARKAEQAALAKVPGQVRSSVSCDCPTAGTSST